MLNLYGKNARRYPIEQAIRSSVAKHLYQAFTGDDENFGKLDKWTERRIHAENMAKVELVFESDDPAEHCYRNLIREIDVEAENGIYLVGKEFQNDALRTLVRDPGISGELHLELPSYAQLLFVDELDASGDESSRLWVTIQARYDRAHLDASVSELVMRFLLNSAEAAADMASALRALTYSYHEHTVRQTCKLPVLLDQRESRDLIIMVAELEKRSGSYDEQVRAISSRAESLQAFISPPKADAIVGNPGGRVDAGFAFSLRYESTDRILPQPVGDQ